MKEVSKLQKAMEDAKADFASYERKEIQHKEVRYWNRKSGIEKLLNNNSKNDRKQGGLR